MTSELLEGVREETRSLREQAEKEYRAVVMRDNKRDKTKLRTLMETLQLTEEQVQADINAVKRRRELQERTADHEKVKAEAEEARAALVAHMEETQRVITERAEGEAPLRQRLDTAQRAAAKMTEAFKELAELEHERWALFGGTDPAATARVRHLMHHFRTKKWPECEYDIVGFEHVMATPEHYRESIGKYEFVVAPGQTEDELTELLALAKRIAGGGGRYSYLVNSISDDEVVAQVGSRPLVLYAGHCARAFDSGINPLAGLTFIPHPGQDQATLDSLVQTLTQRWEKSPAGKDEARRAALAQEGGSIGGMTVQTTVSTVGGERVPAAFGR